VRWKAVRWKAVRWVALHSVGGTKWAVEGVWRGLERDVKPLEGGPVRRSRSPVSESHLANVRQEAPCRFSGYSTVL